MARVKQCHGGTRSTLVRLWAALCAVSFLCACALAGAWCWKESRAWLLCAAALCAAICPFLGNAVRRAQSGRAGEKQVQAALKRLPAGYTVLCNVPLVADGRQTELDAAVVGPGGVCVVEVKHYAGDISGTEQASTWRQTRPGRGGRHIDKTVTNPVAQNRRQVSIVKRVLRQAGMECPVWGVVYFSNPYARVHASAPELVWGEGALCRAVCAQGGLSRVQMRNAVHILTGARR